MSPAFTRYFLREREEKIGVISKKIQSVIEIILSGSYLKISLLKCHSAGIKRQSC
jgi:hypothetical protein